jgi:plastocyanin/mono/diheme cytochrome c family protein
LVILVFVSGYLFWRSHPLVADRPPGAVETAIARRLVVLSIPSDARQQQNPYAADSEAWRTGANHFQTHCAFCHGTDGRASTEIATRMYPPVPDLADPAIQAMSDGALFAVIQNGVRWTGMPAFRGSHRPDEIWQLVSFVRRVPQLTPADLKPPPAPQSGTPGASVVMDGTTFVPPEITVAVGDTVTWTNKDPFPHNVSSAAGGFSSQDLQPGEEWRFTPQKEGRFPYVCTLHPGMKGTLIVGGDKK